MVFRIAFLIPIFLPNISMIGLILFVVQLAHEKTETFPSSVFTPWTTVGVSLVGPEMTTNFAPDVKCFSASALFVKIPVLSMMISA
ncbi:hypothetical protein D3C71_1125050 [compost metagenome]